MRSLRKDDFLRSKCHDLNHRVSFAIGRAQKKKRHAIGNIQFFFLSRA